MEDVIRRSVHYDLDGDDYVTFDEYKEVMFGAEIEGKVLSTTFDCV